MAWISVHEDVNGPKLRDFAKGSGLSRNEALGTLIVLWLWGIKNADQSGLIKSADKRDVADVISSGLSEGFKAIEVVDCMVKSGWIDEENGELYLHDWDEWQEMWYKYIGRREKDTARKRREREKAREEGATPSPADGEAPPAPPPTPKPKKPKKPDKKKFAEFVHLLPEEYKKLVEQFGKNGADKCIEVLDNYKGAKGKRYASDYRAILNWVVKRVKEDYPGLIRAQEQSSTENDNPFGEWGVNHE